MGQRHQIYVRFPSDRDWKTGKFKNKNGIGIAGFHHQWLYGMTAVEALNRVLKFYVNSTEIDDATGKPSSNQYGPMHTDTAYGLKRQSEVIRALYSVDADTGYWHYVHNLLEDETDYASRQDEYTPPSEIVDPRNGDNNDGITIIDLSKGDFRYCFMNICHLEGEVQCKTKLKPMSAREYLLHYYPKFLEKLGRKDQDGVRREIDAETFDRALGALLNIEGKAQLLTLAECKSMFPAMYKRGAK